MGWFEENIRRSREAQQRLNAGMQTTTRTTAMRPVVSAGPDPAAMSAIQKAMALYQKGGGYGKGVEAGLERGRVKAVAGGMQGLVSAGLAGTTMMGGLGKKYEEEVAMSARARVEETRAGAISGLQTLKAQIIQGATEAGRSRALQQYLAQLQSATSLQSGAMRATPSITPARSEPARTVTDGARQHVGGARIPSPFAEGGSRSIASPGDPLSGQRIMGGSLEGGMYLGEGKYLRSEQVG